MKYNLLFLMLSIALLSCQSTDQNSLDKKEQTFHIIPKPVNLTKSDGYFLLNKNTKIVFNKSQLQLEKIGNLLNSQIEFPLSVLDKTEIIESDYILLSLDDSIKHVEGYTLNIKPNSIKISANKPAGLFYGVQTLIQILNFDTKKNKIPSLNIEDYPRFKYRGLHLDVGRHFSTPEFVKKYIDLMSQFKFNRFHWHLTEDQGWRIEIKKYPKLTEIGAWRDSTMTGRYRDVPRRFDYTKQGGFYTQDEVRDIVKYAADRYVTIVPEIELPGHSQAALAAYPELACTDGPFNVLPIWGISNEIYCPKEETFKFLEDVLTEVIDLFPGEYIHIGGDEAPKLRWKESKICQDLIKKEGLKDEHELQSYFIQRIEKFVNSKGRKIIGWDEILEGGLAPNAAVMSWRGEIGGIKAAKQKHFVVMTPGDYCYFDHYQSLDPNEPLAIGGFTPIDKVYSYNPIPEELSDEEAKYIMGAQANLWTEYLPTPELREYMVYPRALALAEVVWTPQDKRDYKDFIRRLLPNQENLATKGINVANRLADITAKFSNTGKGIRVNLTTSLEEVEIFYSIDGSDPSKSSLKYSDPFEITKDAELKAVAYLGQKQMGSLFSRKVALHKAAGKTMILKNEPSPKYNKGGENAIINGIKGSDIRYSDEQWLGFEGKDFNGVIDFAEPTEINKVSMRFFNIKGSWIYPPKEIKLFASQDNHTFQLVGKTKINDYDESNLLNVSLNVFKNTKSQYLKVIVKRFGIIPEGKQGGGHEAWLFVDEIVVE